jgi:UDP-N-acetylglucosamine 2-epimerase (non-hydrolysing)
MLRLINVAGARPNFIKIAPLVREFRSRPEIESILVHTGQHYDEKMSDLFFRQLEIPEPDINLGVGGGSHATQTAAIMTAFEPVILDRKPDAVLVVGDVNSTVACGLVAKKLGVRLIHVEAGLRSFDQSMPEEINRIVTDSISDLLFCSEQSGVDNLLREGHDPRSIHLVGNVMIDSLLRHLEHARALPVLAQYGLKAQQYAVVTLHRPSNVDTQDAIEKVVEILLHIEKRMPVIFPLHPRTRQNFEGFGYLQGLEKASNITLTEPLGYFEFLALTSSARVVVTDSGGIQEETTILGVPCLTLRENTERPSTCNLGTNCLAGTDPVGACQIFDDVIARDNRKPKRPPMWDGHSAFRIADLLTARGVS